MLEKNFYDHDYYYLHLCEGKTKQEASEAAIHYAEQSVGLCRDETNKPKIIERRLYEIRRIAQALHHGTSFGSEFYDAMSEIVSDMCILEKTPVSKVLTKCEAIIPRYELIIQTFPKDQQPAVKHISESLMQLEQLIILLDNTQ